MTKQNRKISRSDKSSGGFLRGKAGWYVALFIVSCWMFFLGILVGRGTMPIKFNFKPIKNELTNLKRADEQEELERVKKAAEAAKAPSEMDFYEELKKGPSEPQPVRQAAPQPESDKNKVRPAPVKKAEKKPTRTRVVKRKVVNPAEDKGRQSAGEKRFTIQAASVKELAEAEKLVARLKEKGFPAYETIGIIPEKGIWFRVRIGRFASEAEAADTMKRLKKEGYQPLLIHTQE